MVEQYIPIFMIFAVAIGLVSAMLFLNSRLGPKPKMTASKAEPFECGVPTNNPGSPRRITVRFYLIAILFVLFDLEAIFLYPWALIYRQLGLYGLGVMASFVAILWVGLAYAWRRGALDWA